MQVVNFKVSLTKTRKTFRHKPQKERRKEGGKEDKQLKFYKFIWELSRAKRSWATAWTLLEFFAGLAMLFRSLLLLQVQLQLQQQLHPSSFVSDPDPDPAWSVRLVESIKDLIISFAALAQLVLFELQPAAVAAAAATVQQEQHRRPLVGGFGQLRL